MSAWWITGASRAMQTHLDRTAVTMTDSSVVVLFTSPCVQLRTKLRTPVNYLNLLLALFKVKVLSSLVFSFSYSISPPMTLVPDHRPVLTSTFISSKTVL